MQVITYVNSLQKVIKENFQSGFSLGFVPTMGALHSGHLSLLKKAREENTFTVVSIFVNPTQFNDPEDLKKYPRNLEKDLQMLEQSGCDLVFTPSVKEIYTPEYMFSFNLGYLDTIMEGKHRPGHFNGVASVVNRLFEIVKPTRAYFGEKDYQQLAVINNMVRELDLPVTIIPCPIIREPDGLAMSSRNMLLGKEQRKSAPRISQTLIQAAAMNRSLSLKETENWVQTEINKDPFLKTEYFQIVNAETLALCDNWIPDQAMIGCVAVQAGNIRLIDNVKF